jgi:hypothetical protein
MTNATATTSASGNSSIVPIYSWLTNLPGAPGI